MNKPRGCRFWKTLNVRPKACGGKTRAMSDFVNNGWSVYIAALTVLGLLGCLVLLFVAARRRVYVDAQTNAQTKAQAPADNSTGHVWDEDLRELNNPLPRWWMWLFVLTVVFSAVYLVLYPGLGSAAGSLKWTSVQQHDTEQAAAQALAAPLFAAHANTPVQALASNPQAMAMGERLYANHCAACHGADAHGSKGFPNLSDKDWLWGGAPDRIEETISKGRQALMPAMATAVGTADDVRNLANFVLTLSGGPDSVKAQLGRPKFAVCAACHGADGKGNTALGAPNLTDDVWLHGAGEDAIVAMVTHGKTNSMPAFAERLSAPQIHVLSAYVWGLSNPNKAAQ
jgi:cytochrome c oxidase cbb3-type subunit III